MIRNVLKKNISPDDILDEGERLLLLESIKLYNNYYIKDNSKKNNIFSIPVTFISYPAGSICKVKVESNIRNQFNKGDIIDVDFTCLRIIPEFVFNYFVLKDVNNLNSDLFLDNSKENSNLIYTDYMINNACINKEINNNINSLKKEKIDETIENINLDKILKDENQKSDSKEYIYNNNRIKYEKEDNALDKNLSINNDVNKKINYPPNKKKAKNNKKGKSKGKKNNNFISKILLVISLSFLIFMNYNLCLILKNIYLIYWNF